MDITLSVVAVALEYLGIPYKYGGADREGMDCSGFVISVMKRFKIIAPRRARDYVNFGREVSPDSLMPGDILLFRFEQTYVDHVGIYIGDNKVIHASPKKGVVVESLEYIKKYLIGARRIDLPIRTLPTHDTITHL